MIVMCVPSALTSGFRKWFIDYCKINLWRCPIDIVSGWFSNILAPTCLCHFLHIQMVMAYKPIVPFMGNCSCASNSFGCDALNSQKVAWTWSKVSRVEATVAFQVMLYPVLQNLHTGSWQITSLLKIWQEIVTKCLKCTLMDGFPLECSFTRTS